MPSSAARPCSYPGCTTLVRGQIRCVQHPQVIQRDAQRQRLYNTAHWRKLRDAQLVAHPWCADCLRANTYTVATDVDHIEPHHGDVRKFFHGALQSLCKSCHSRKTVGEILLSRQTEGL